MTGTDEAALRQLNERIGQAESAADRHFFEALLCQQFVMQRPSGRLDDRTALIGGLATGARRITQDIEVEIHPANRAVVSCLVTKWEDPDGTVVRPPGDASVFHNLRVFIRDEPSAPWKMLAWLNEPHLPGQRVCHKSV